MVIYLSLLVALVGMLLYILCGNPSNQNPPTPTGVKVAELGRISFFAGLLAFLLLAERLLAVLR
jgi:hypothetical protein